MIKNEKKDDLHEKTDFMAAFGPFRGEVRPELSRIISICFKNNIKLKQYHCTKLPVRTSERMPFRNINVCSSDEP